MENLNFKVSNKEFSVHFITDYEVIEMYHSKETGWRVFVDDIDFTSGVETLVIDDENEIKRIMEKYGLLHLMEINK